MTIEEKIKQYSVRDDTELLYLNDGNDEIPAEYLQLSVRDNPELFVSQAPASPEHMHLGEG